MTEGCVAHKKAVFGPWKNSPWGEIFPFAVPVKRLLPGSGFLSPLFLARPAEQGGHPIGTRRAVLIHSPSGRISSVEVNQMAKKKLKKAKKLHGTKTLLKLKLSDF